MAEVVFYDYKQVKEGGIPSQIIRKMKKASGEALPHVLITSADLSQNFGVYNHKSLKSLDFRSILKEAKNQVREAKDKGLLSSYTAVATKKSDDEVSSSSDQNVIIFDSPAMEDWQSSVGTTITAKLIKVEFEKVLFLENASGKVIKVRIDQLSEASANKVREMIKS